MAWNDPSVVPGVLVKVALNVPLNCLNSPVEIRRALPWKSKDTVDPVVVFAKLKGERPDGLLADTNAGITGVQTCAGTWFGFGGLPHCADPSVPRKMNVRSSAMSGDGTVPVGLKVRKFV